MAFFPPNNALAWSHFRLRGGWMRALTITSGAVTLLGVLIIASARLNPDGRNQSLFGWVTGLLVLELATLVLFGAGRVSAVIRQDVASRMIESHRQMPLSPLDAIAGYVMGASGPVLIFFSGIFILGALTAAAGGIDFTRWAFANGMLLAFAVFLWFACAYAGFGAKMGALLVFIPMLIPSMTQGGAITLLPGVSILLSPLIGHSVFDMRTATLLVPAPFAMALAAQAYFSLIFFLAAARKYRSADTIGMSTLLSLCMLAGWVAISCTALHDWDEFRPRGWSPVTVTPPTQVIASIIMSLILTVPAISANAMERARWRRHQSAKDPAPTSRPIPLSVVILTAIVMILAIPFASRESALPTSDMLLRTATCIAIAMIGLYFLFSLFHSAGSPAAILIFIWMLVTWGVPIVVDLIRYGLAESGEVDQIATFSSCSPVGAIIILWNHAAAGSAGGVTTTPGIIVQLLVVALPGVYWCMFLLRNRLGRQLESFDPAV